MNRVRPAWSALLLATALGGCSFLGFGTPALPGGSKTTSTVGPVASTPAPPEGPASASVPSISVGGPTTIPAGPGPASPPPATVTVFVTPSAPPPQPEPPSAPPKQGGKYAAFASPSGRIVCLMIAGEEVRCDYLLTDNQWKVPAPGCQYSSGRYLMVNTVNAGGACVSDSIADTPVPVSEFTSWWHPGELMATLPGSSLKVAALAYGTSLQVTSFRCDSAESGVTCRNTVTGRGFMLSRESYRIF